MFDLLAAKLDISVSSRLGFRVCLVAILLTFGGIAASGQDGTQTRTITSEGFAQQRPVVAAGISVTRPKVRPDAPAKKPSTYRLSRRNSSSLRFKGAATPGRTQPKPAATEIRFSDIGVTIWKLRKPLLADLGIRLPVRIAAGQTEMWTAERVPLDSRFAAGDRVRFAVESPTSGYLYLVNAEVSDDGTLGTPRLIFPETVAQNNAVRPGMLVDAPDRNEANPYFKLDPRRAGYAGELVAIVVSPVKLNIELGDDGQILNIGDLIDLQGTVEFEIFDREDNGDRIYSQAEADASCGAKTRDLVREKPGAPPCQDRALTRDQPMPQTIMRVKTRVGLPAVAFVRLNAGN